MLITRLKLRNWRNFQEADICLRDTVYLLGANASGKSNLLDVFRFLRDISKPRGGGLQKAVEDRGGFSKLRCLHARRDPEVSIEIEISDNPDDEQPKWKYRLSFTNENYGKRRPIVKEEKVWRTLEGVEELILNRPNEGDRDDTERLTETHLEQVQANSGFREIADFFSKSTYLHLVPQLLKYSEKIGGNRLEDDPFGQGFLERIAKTADGVRKARLKKIEKALQTAIPHFEGLKYESDAIGHPHLEMKKVHHRPDAGWQNEEHFSDGTLRLIGLLWSLLESNSLLLLEEPELSLNDAIVEQIPLILSKIQRNKSKKRQIIISTHSEALLKNKGIDARQVLLLKPDKEGTTIRGVDKEEEAEITDGFSIAEVMLAKARPNKDNNQLEFDL